MRHRKLRIAWSVACGIICLLLVALWVRSYFSFDELTLWGNGVQSANGRVNFYWNQPPESPQWRFWSLPPGEALVGVDFLYTFGPPGQGSVMCLPYWLFASIVIPV